MLNEDVGNEVLLNQVTSIQGDNGELKSKVVKSYLMSISIILHNYIIVELAK